MSQQSSYRDLNGDDAVAQPQPTNTVLRYLSRFDDGELARWVFRGLLLGAIGVLVLDLRDLSNTNGLFPTFSSLPGASEPILPPVRDVDGARPNSTDPRDHVTTAGDKLGGDMRFELEGGGRLVLTGSIRQGTADSFAKEVEARGEYIQTISLNSPGGALEDAMAMARLIREKGFATEVADGALCASSCPLIFIGGKARQAGDKSAIGLHQFYAGAGSPTDAASALSSAQETTARISRFLVEMDIDPLVWLHALDTPPQALYYLTAEELGRYRMVTGAGPVASLQ